MCVCLSFPTGLFYLQSERRLHYHPDSLMVTGQVSSCRGLYHSVGGGLVTQDKIRPTNSKRQRTDESEGKRMEEWKEVITPDWAG